MLKLIRREFIAYPNTLNCFTNDQLERINDRLSIIDVEKIKQAVVQQESFYSKENYYEYFKDYLEVINNLNIPKDGYIIALWNTDLTEDIITALEFSNDPGINNMMLLYFQQTFYNWFQHAKGSIDFPKSLHKYTRYGVYKGCVPFWQTMGQSGDSWYAYLCKEQFDKLFTIFDESFTFELFLKDIFNIFFNWQLSVSTSTEGNVTVEIEPFIERVIKSLSTSGLDPELYEALVPNETFLEGSKP